MHTNTHTKHTFLKPDFLKKKSFLYGALILAALIVVIVLIRSGNKGEEILVVHAGDFVQEVSVSGKVIAAENVDLVFSESGRVSGVYAKVGDKVSRGAVLASLENGDRRAEVLEKEAAYEAAQSKLRSLQAGTRIEQIAITESKLQDAQIKLVQSKQKLVDTLKNAYTQSDDAVRRRVDQFITNPRSSDPRLNFTVETQLKTSIEWERFLLEPVLVSWKASVDVLSSSSNLAESATEALKNLEQVRVFLDKAALAVNSAAASPSLSQSTIDSYRADITAARSNVNTALSSLTAATTEEKNAAASLQIAERNLLLEKAGATPEALAEEEARVKAAEAELLNARARLAKTLVLAPFSGIVTKMDVKTGSSASPDSAGISMISEGSFLVESFVPEINLPLLEVGDKARVLLDAYGDTPFAVSVISIDPAETVRDGVSTYKVQLQFTEHDNRIRPGMTASVTIVTEKKTNIISVPQKIIIHRDGKKFVLVEENDSFVERAVVVGSVSSLGTIEIVSGLSEGDKVLLNREKEE